MPRQSRLDAPGTLHHVIGRGIERRKIFLKEDDYEDFVRRLDSVSSRTDVRVFAWSLLPNHFHLLLRTGDVGLSSVMRGLMTGYAVAFNRRHRRHGHLFQNRYQSIVCEEEVYFLELVRYIHLNVLRARVVSNLEELGRYRYAGHSALMGEVERPWQGTASVLGRFGEALGEARRRYEQFVEAGVSHGRRPELVGGGLRRSCGAWSEVPRRRRRKEEAPSVYDERILGSSEFVTGILSDAAWERREKLRRLARGRSLAELGERAAALAGISVAELCSGSRRSAVVKARQALAQVAVGELGHPGATVARYLGVATSTVNRQMGRPESGPLAQRLLEMISGPENQRFAHAHQRPSCRTRLC